MLGSQQHLCLNAAMRRGYLGLFFLLPPHSIDATITLCSVGSVAGWLLCVSPQLSSAPHVLGTVPWGSPCTEAPAADPIQPHHHYMQWGRWTHRCAISITKASPTCVQWAAQHPSVPMKLKHH